MVATQDVDMALMPDIEDESTEPETLADRHDGVSTTQEHVQATFEYTIEISNEKIAELTSNSHKTPEEWACRVACSQAEHEHNLTFSVDDATAQEDQRMITDGKSVYTVFVRVSQNQ
jgi:thiamine monophosphate kinase